MKDFSWKVQPLQPADLIAVKDLQPPEFGDIMPAVTFYTTSAFCHPIKILVENVVAGIGTTILFHDTAWLAHIIVHPDYRNRGIGSFITQNLVKSVDATIYKTISLIATALGEPVYKKLGFKKEANYLFFKDGQTDVSFASENIIKFEDKYRTAIFDLDKITTDENRQLRLNEEINNAWIYVENQKLGGFYFPTLGDGLIVAENPVAGVALMNFRNRTNKFCVLPKDNDAAVSFLNEHNFNHYRTASRMRLGNKRKWLPQNIYNRVSGQIG